MYCFWVWTHTYRYCPLVSSQHLTPSAHPISICWKLDMLKMPFQQGWRDRQNYYNSSSRGTWVTVPNFNFLLHCPNWYLNSIPWAPQTAHSNAQPFCCLLVGYSHHVASVHLWGDNSLKGAQEWLNGLLIKWEVEMLLYSPLTTLFLGI